MSGTFSHAARKSVSLTVMMHAVLCISTLNAAKNQETVKTHPQLTTGDAEVMSHHERTLYVCKRKADIRKRGWDSGRSCCASQRQKSDALHDHHHHRSTSNAPNVASVSASRQRHTMHGETILKYVCHKLEEQTHTHTHTHTHTKPARQSRHSSTDQDGMNR